MTSARSWLSPWAGVVLGACLWSPGARASIVYQDIPDISFRATGYYGHRIAPLDLDSDGVTDLELHLQWNRLAYQSGTYAATFGSCSTYNDHNLLFRGPRRLADGVEIGPASNYWGDGGGLYYSGEQSGGFWGGAGYLGFEVPQGADFLYGWVYMSATAESLDVFSFAYESEVNTPIAAGAVPGPGTGVWLIAFLGAAGLRRKRANVARARS